MDTYGCIFFAEYCYEMCLFQISDLSNLSVDNVNWDLVY